MKRFLELALAALLVALMPNILGAQTTVPPAFFGMTQFHSTFPLGSGITLGTEGKSSGEYGYDIMPSCDGGGDPNNPCYVWTDMDTWVNTALANNWTLIYDFDAMPLWMCPGQAAPANGPRCLGSVPVNMTALGHLATAIATRYKGKIKYYETYNEMNEPTDWTGSCANIVLWHNTVYNAVKVADPSAIVGAPNVASGHLGLSGGCTSSPNPNGVVNEWIFVQNFLATPDPNGNYARVDAIGHHAYGNTAVFSPGSSLLDTVAQYTLNIYNNFRATATAAGISTSTPILITEGSWGTDNPNPNCSAPLNETGCLSSPDQAAYIGRFLVLLASTWSDGGGTLANWYAFDASWGTLNGTSGMNAQNAAAYGQLEGWLAGATFSHQCQAGTPSTVVVCDFTVAGENREIIFNNNNGLTASYNAPAWALYYTQLLGVRTPVSGAITVGNTPILLLSSLPSAPTALTAIIR